MSVTIHHLREWRARGQRFVMVTAYDMPSARILDEAGIPVLLVGDTLAQVMLGYPTTLPVSMDEMLHHARAVARGARNALLVGDMPFGTYHANDEDAIRNAGAYLQAGMHAVKMEGGGRIVGIVEKLVERGIPVMGHLGLTPQFVNLFGGYKVQGRGDAGDRVVEAARELEDAGAFSIVLECVPSEVGKRVTDAVRVPTIGIGAGPHTDAQVLVYHDLLGMTPGDAPRFVKRYADLTSEISNAVKMFAKEVSEGIYPGPEHSYTQVSEFHVGGYVLDAQGAIEAVLVGELLADGGRLRYSGFVDCPPGPQSERLGAIVSRLSRASSPFDSAQSDARTRVVYVEPRIRVGVRYLDRADDGTLQQAVCTGAVES